MTKGDGADEGQYEFDPASGIGNVEVAVDGKRGPCVLGKWPAGGALGLEADGTAGRGESLCVYLS
jgi:hypothetical protein